MDRVSIFITTFLYLLADRVCVGQEFPDPSPTERHFLTSGQSYRPSGVGQYSGSPYGYQNGYLQPQHGMSAYNGYGYRPNGYNQMGLYGYPGVVGNQMGLGMGGYQMGPGMGGYQMGGYQMEPGMTYPIPNNAWGNYQYGPRANSLFDAFSNFWTNSQFYRQRNSGDKTGEIFNTTLTIFTEIVGRVDEACLLKLLCEASSQPNHYGRFYQFAHDFFKAVGESLTGELSRFAKAFSVRIESCSQTYVQCSKGTVELRELLRTMDLL